ncbi:probable pectinesterase 15 [Zingiber officinale]|uniref:probable pectinesterase 15 n=1 Tax=Zingiber officinale TaxID=94328 RepID=UPI001C4D5FF7|nr:probable pectinesterase 15 [Zingiber officinale]
MEQQQRCFYTAYTSLTTIFNSALFCSNLDLVGGPGDPESQGLDSLKIHRSPVSSFIADGVKATTVMSTPIMKPFFFWTSAVAVALVSILLHLNHVLPHGLLVLPSANTASNALSPSLLWRSGRHRHRSHHRRRPKTGWCDSSRWASPIASEQNVTLVLTVDQQGCADFSSVQMAVDAVPEFSLSRTLIIVDAGIYRWF